MSAVKRSGAALASKDMLEAFRNCPQMDAAVGRSFCPAVVDVCTMIGDTLGLGWEWPCLALMSCAPALSPRDRMEMFPSNEIRAVVWACLCHPGATNSSGVIKVFHRALGTIMHRMEQCETAIGHANGQNAKFKAKKRTIVAGGGSVAATGLQMASEENRSAAVSVEPEIDVFLGWLQQEVGIDKGVAGKLWDASTWHRPVMNGAKAFTVEHMFFSICNAGHIPEIYEALQGGDAFGLRQRLTVLAPRPTFQKAAFIRAACAALPVPSHKPEEFVASLLFPLMFWSVVVKRDCATCFVPCEADGALALIDGKFDFRTQKQGECYSVDGLHEDCKAQGKMKHKYDRAVFALHYVEAVCQYFMDRCGAATFDSTSMQSTEYIAQFSVPLEVPRRVFEFGYWFAGQAEAHWSFLDLSRKGMIVDALDEVSSAEEDVAPLSKRRRLHPTIPDVEEVRRHISERHAMTRDNSLGLCNTSMEVWMETLRRFEWTDYIRVVMLALLVQTPGQWCWCRHDQCCVDTGTMACKIDKIATVYGFTESDSYFGQVVGFFILERLGFGVFKRSQACLGGGSRICYFAKRPIHNGDVVQAGLQGVIDLVLPNCNQQVFDNFCMTTTAGEKPMSAPVIDWSLHCVDDANACAFVHHIGAFM